MIKKKKILFITILLVAFAIPIKGYATTFNPTTDGDDATETWEEDKTFYDSGIYRYRCKFEAAYSASYTLNASAIDTENNEILKDDWSVSKYTLSGTWVGINVNEHSHSTWKTQNIERYKMRRKYKCTYTSTTECDEWNYVTSPSTSSACDTAKGCTYKANSTSGASSGTTTSAPGSCTCPTTCKTYSSYEEEYVKEYNESFTCPEVDGYTVAQEELDPPDDVQLSGTGQCKDKILTKVRQKARSLLSNSKNTVSYIDTNDYKEFTLADVAVDSKDPTCGGGVESGQCDIEYNHHLSKVCIDVKTGLVYYAGNCKSEYKTIEDVTVGGKVYWHYFAPLNARSDSRFYVEISQKNGNSLDLGFCKSAMKKYTNYYNLISPIDVTKTYNGSYNQSGTGSADYRLLSNEKGCRTSIKIVFDLNQKFYNESGRDNDLRGYKFYFRQVDITKPFNTRPNQSSLWYNWYQANRSSPNFNDSFKEVSYRAIINRPQDIRNYADPFNDPYTSWQKISAEGKSEFIDTYVRRENTGKIYKLGCGPANEDWSGCK